MTDRQKVIIHSILDLKLENVLNELYVEHNIKSGDISPEQSGRWDELVENIYNLFIELIEQNETKKEPEDVKCFTVKDMIEFGNTCREIGRRDLLNNINTIFGGKSEKIQPKVEEIFKDWVQEGEDTINNEHN